jgi:phosphatidylglycerophosphate synthase
MKQHQLDNDTFVVTLLTTLREEQYSLNAWWRFLLYSWRRSRETARTHPSLMRSWKQVTALMGILVVGMCIATLVFEGEMALLRLLPGLLFCVAWQQSDLFWHLGLNRNGRAGLLYERVGLANVLTGVRGLCASYLLARIVGGLHTPTRLAFSLFILGIGTDILDGMVARITGTQSTLGQIADAEADFCLYGTMSILLMQNALLPLWLGIVMIARFLIPFVSAVISYFCFTHTLHFGSTRWGKYAGLCQCLYFFVLLAPPQFAPFTYPVTTPLLLVMLLLFVVALFAQIIANMQKSYL